MELIYETITIISTFFSLTNLAVAGTGLNCSELNASNLDYKALIIKSFYRL